MSAGEESAALLRRGVGFWAGVLASAVLAGLYAQGGAGWVLGFVMGVPWLTTLDTRRSFGAAALSAWAMSVAFTAAVFPWFGAAIGRIAGIPEAAGVALLLAAAPLFQPQFFAFALVRHATRRRHGAALGACAAAAAWVAAERLTPKLLGDTLGIGLYPAALLRQAADLGGVAGLTLALLLAHEALAAAWQRRREGVRAWGEALAWAAAGPLLLAGYGAAREASPPAGSAVPALRMGLVQSAIVDYERLRRERGAGAVVREVLDTHYAMSHDAVERQKVQAVLWSETVYPTTFGRPKSEAGAELDREILGIVNAAGVPFVFGTYERDGAAEYNAAAFVAPGSGLVGFYRKARPFPLTEWVPGWLDGPLLRRWLPWAGTWQPGDGARVFPLRLADGRAVPVLPLICLDATDPRLAIDGARLGAALILGLSNDSWFTEHPQGARLHLAVAAFRSIETRLPQFRVTSNGYSAVIASDGSILAGTNMGERTLVVGELPLREPPRTLVVRWGDWVGLAAAAFLAALMLTALLRAWRVRQAAAGLPPAGAPALPAWPVRVAVLPPAVRIATGMLRTFAHGSLLAMAATVLLGEGALASNTMAQLRAFVVLFVAPELAAMALLRAFGATLEVRPGKLVLARGAERSDLALAEVAAIEAWTWPLPMAGLWLRLASGERWHHGLAGIDAATLQTAMASAGRELPVHAVAWAQAFGEAQRAAPHGWLGRWWAKFVLLPLVLAVPAFRLHQHIAYGSSFGEYLAFGAWAYAQGFLLWWAGWIVAVVLCAAVLRALVEALTLLVALLRPPLAPSVHQRLRRSALALLCLGLPGWLLWRMVGG